MGTTSTSIEQTIRDAVGVAQQEKRADAVAAALQSIHAGELDVFFHAGLGTTAATSKPATVGLPASPGAAVGEYIQGRPFQALVSIQISDQSQCIPFA